MIPVYIGISRRFDCIKDLARRSILDNTSADVDITLLYPEEESGCTGFSNVRYTIEHGIYLDCDMIVLGDISELWAYRQSGRFVCMYDGSTEVAVIDCNHECKNKYNHNLLPMTCTIPEEWNVEDYKYFNKPLPNNIKLFHFTSLPTQPWFYEHPSKEALELYGRYCR